ncbi:Biopolymer transport protein ExbD [Alteromonadaceae bacterium Bs31]|nr:Biopolymer transport protein ExbD [Alteromonadaceae bacterium Bs31]
MLTNTAFYSRDNKAPSAKLSLIALMDIFTILVFFLLLNSGDSKNIEQAEFVKLPDSSSGKAPHADLMVVVGDEQLFVGSTPIAEIGPILEKPDEFIEALQQALTEHKEKITELTAFEKEKGLSLTIMGHRDVPYALVRSVMATCREQGFLNISLAVNRVAADVQGQGMFVPDDGVGG